MGFKYFLIFFGLVSFDVYAGQFTTGLGYLAPEKYRRDNEINPLPLGLSIVPMIAYRSERLTVLGPRVSYYLLRSFLSVSANINMAGDNYKANILDERDTAIHTGLTLRIPYFSVSYEHDISGTHKGGLLKVSIGKSFFFNKDFFLRINLAREFVSSQFSDYYYSVKAHEVGLFELYSLGKAQNTLLSLNSNYRMNDTHSMSFLWVHKRFDSDIANSPTIRLKNYNTFGLFWNYTL